MIDIDMGVINVQRNVKISAEFWVGISGVEWGVARCG